MYKTEQSWFFKNFVNLLVFIGVEPTPDFYTVKIDMSLVSNATNGTQFGIVYTKI